MNKGRILIAEDERHTRNTLSFVLENAGYQVTEVENGHEALHQVLLQRQSKQAIDLMIVDVEMAGLTGWELLDQLQQQQAALPTIVITGLNEQREFRQRQCGKQFQFLKKPFTPDSLIACVSAMLRPSPQNAALLN